MVCLKGAIFNMRHLKKKSIIKDPSGFFAFFYNYIGPISVFAYLYSLIKTRWRLPVKDWLFLFTLSMFFVVSVLVSSFVDSVMTYRFYWGFFIFYLYFRTRYHQFDLKSLLVLMLIMIAVEGALVNTIVDASNLPNYPDKETAATHFSDTWQRIYSFGGNSSVTGVLIVTVLSVVNAGLFLIFCTLVTVFFIGSGSGGFAFIFYLLYRLNLKNIIVFLGLMIYVWLAIVPNIEMLYKISPYYIDLLVDLKKLQILQILNEASSMDILIGTNSAIDMGGDFLWANFFKIYGISGVILMLFIILSNINRLNVIGILLVLIMTSHYFVLFSLPGQLIVGYLLAMRQTMNGYNDADFKVSDSLPIQGLK